MPVKVQCRHGLSRPLVIDLDDDEVVFGSHQGGNLEVKRSKAAQMFAEEPTVQIDVCPVVGGAEIEEKPRAGFFLAVERFLYQIVPS